jgi:hypothetical protein
LHDTGVRAGHRPEANAWLTAEPIMPELVNSLLEAPTHSLGSSVAATQILAPPG